jgi:putative type II restriction endonuclease
MIHFERGVVMNEMEQKKAAKEFSERWKDRGYEKGESQKYWIDLLSNVLGVSNATEFIEFEDTVHIDKSTGFIDGFIDKTKVLIEQKSIEKDLRKTIKQSDGSLLNPFQQAKRYSSELPYDDRPRWIVTCNFKSMLVYDMNNPNGEPEEILLQNLSKEYYRLSFLVDSKNEHIKKEEELSFKAGELVGKLYDAFSKEYKDITNEQSQKDLNELCVRLVFCLYAEDAGLFGKKSIFHDYLAKYDDLTLMRDNLIKLFKTLDTKEEDRDPYLEDDLNQFPYVNGGLFSNENIEIPKFTDEIKSTLLAKASDEFDWSEISPTIFGAVFESTLNPETRRSGGMHYTSIENIHKVIDPLFLDDLRDKLNKAESIKNEKIRNDELRKFQEYLGTLKFFDPACGSGNFLTETYLSLRRLENEALEVIQGGKIALDLEGTIKVSIQQFYGIEINDFAVKVAKTALWIAEAQMFQETKNIIYNPSGLKDILPLETYENIVEGNALRTDWNEVLPNTECNYIMGNPPFIGARLMNEYQKEDIATIFKGIKNAGNIDYVGCWYLKSSMYMLGTKIETALVSTNSICQGEQPEILWKPLIEKGIEINFAYRTFKWESDAKKKASVFCIIVGFSYEKRERKLIFNEKNIFKNVKNINAYLIDSDNVFIKSRTNGLCDIPRMGIGNKPIDGGYYLFTEEEMNEFIKKEPLSKKWFKKWYGAKEFIENKPRYCLWLKHCNPNELRMMPEVLKRIRAVKEYRLNSTSEGTRKIAEEPTKFHVENFPVGTYIVVPEVSTDKRKYIPIGFMDSSVLCSNLVKITETASLYHFGVLTSNVHMSWVRATCGRLGNGYRYSVNVVYNNFPWPEPTEKEKEKIERTAQLILDARAKYFNSSLSDLYDELTMPVEVRKAHQENDKAVMDAYGFDWRKMTESDCVAELMKMYQKLTEEK